MNALATKQFRAINGEEREERLEAAGMTMIRCSNESMKYWIKLEPTDENVSRLIVYCNSELSPLHNQ